MIKNVIFILCVSLLFGSCSNFINKFYKQIDEQDKRKRPKKYDNFDFYRGKKRKTLSKFPSNRVSSKNFKNLSPNIKRRYQNQRVKADDLVDNENPGSLWIGRGQSNFLFSRNNAKKTGDIILIKVTQNLKNDISSELKRVFPRRYKKKKSKKSTNPKTTQKRPAPPPAADQKSSKSKVYDQISSIVTEEISKEHLILKGRKQILFRGIKRLIEVKGLAARKSILDDDTIYSVDLLESQVRVLR